MSGVTGKIMAMAVAKCNTWGTPASVTKGVYFNDDGGLQLKPAYVDDISFGQAFLGPADVGDIASPDLTWSTRNRYEDSGQLLMKAEVIGSPNAAVISTSATGQTTSWKHVIDLAPNIDGLAITAAIDRFLYVDEVISAKVYGFSVTNGDGGVMDLSFKVMGAKSTNTSTTNTRSTVNGSTFPALRANRIFRKHGVLRMNANTAGSLLAADAIQIAESASFEVVRPQDAPNVYGQDYVIEPADNGFPTFTFNVTYSRMTTTSANSLFTALSSAGPMKADWVFSGAFINSTDRWTEMYQFPYLELQDFKTNTQGAQQVKPQAQFMAKFAPTSPNGMPFINPFRLTLIVQNSIAAF